MLYYDHSFVIFRNIKYCVFEVFISKVKIAEFRFFKKWNWGKMAKNCIKNSVRSEINC